MASDVYYMDFKTSPGKGLEKKFTGLLRKAGLDEMEAKRKFIALKVHFGEEGNLGYIQHDYARLLSTMLKERGALPFLTDTNTLYSGRRANAVEHIEQAHSHGFTPLSTGCNVIIADGLKGTDYTEVEIKGKHCEKAKIGRAIVDADAIIFLTHFKGHEVAVFGGALKNMSMGCAAVGGKLFMHSDSIPVIRRKKCTGCRICFRDCAHGAIHMDSEDIAVIEPDKCVGCGQCVALCQYDAATIADGSDSLQEKMMEYALAAVKGKPALYINIVKNVTPDCDCWSYNDVPIAPDIGIFASSDPVALDRACLDAVNQAPVIENSRIGGKCRAGEDKFIALTPGLDWKPGLKYAEELGLGSQQYGLHKVD